MTRMPPTELHKFKSTAKVQKYKFNLVHFYSVIAEKKRKKET